MPATPPLPVARHWNTWSGRPAEMVFLPLGVRLTPLAFAASTGKATDFPAGAARLGPRAIDAGHVALELEHAGTRLAWRYRKPDPFIVCGEWDALALGEWGLRFWVCLCIAADGGETVHLDPASGAAVVKVGHRFVAVAMATPPALVTAHDTIAALAEEYERHGYWHLAARADQGPMLALRCNLEMHRTGRFAAAVADREDLAIARARAALADQAAPTPPLQEGVAAGALDAVRDVIGWNTVWDTVNARPYISLSRNWNVQKFGGFGVWLDDQLFAAAMAACLDPEVARETLAVALAGATPEGNLPCLLTANDAWVDRSQIPVAAFMAWLVAQRGGSRAVLATAFPALMRNHDWWWRVRDPHDTGLAAYGTSAVGEGLYQGTHFGARNESSMDNAPYHDTATLDPATCTLDLADVGLNSLLALDAEILAGIAAELGDDAAATRLAARARRTCSLIREQLWDESRGIFANRHRDGRFVPSLGPTSFFPLVCGAATAKQTARLVAELANPATFGGAVVVPSVPRDDPAFADNTYWRGRVWPPLNLWVWHGLRRAGFASEASKLAAASMKLFDRAWARRLCPENYNATTGEALDQPDTDGFYTWGALLPMLGLGELMDLSPWHGWCVTNNGHDARLGPIETPGGTVTLTIADGMLALARGATRLLVSDLPGDIRHLDIGARHLCMDLPPAGGTLTLPGMTVADIVACQLADRPATLRDTPLGLGVVIPAATGRRRLMLLHAGHRPING